MDIKEIKVSRFKDDELIQAQTDVESFIKFLENEYKNAKKLEEENS